MKGNHQLPHRTDDARISPKRKKKLAIGTAVALMLISDSEYITLFHFNVDAMPSSGTSAAYDRDLASLSVLWLASACTDHYRCALDAIRWPVDGVGVVAHLILDFPGSAVSQAR